MSKLTLQELNGLSPRARKAHEDSKVISEILTENPNEIKEVEIYDMMGQKVFQSQYSPVPYLSGIPNTQISIDVSKWNSGIYFVSVTDEGGNKVMRKMVKM